jgi:hypothetical protein
MHAKRFKNSAHWTASDDSCARRRRPQNNPTGAVPPNDIMVQRPAFTQWNANQRPFRGLCRLPNSFRHFPRFPMPITHSTFLIADHHERRKSKSTPALHHFRDAINMDKTVHELAVAFFAASPAFAVTRHILVPS